MHRGEAALPTGDEFLIAGTLAQMQCQGGTGRSQPHVARNAKLA